tara:strand:- start:32 stop:364 length:333 start_codon:yes stop_codon:yes gene_type:complete
MARRYHENGSLPHDNKLFQPPLPLQGNLMSIIWTILIGFVVGLIARAIKPGNDSAGFIVTTVIGIVGSLVATYLGQAMGWYAAGQAAGFIASVVGAIILLVIWGFIKSKT